MTEHIITKYKQCFGLTHAQIMQMPRSKFAKLCGVEYLEMSNSKFLKIIKRQAKKSWVPLKINTGYLRLKKLFENAKDRCTFPSPRNNRYYIDKNIHFDLTLEQLALIWIRDNAFEMRTPSLDRIDSNENYTYQNCRIIEWQLNRKRKKNNTPVILPATSP